MNSFTIILSLLLSFTLQCNSIPLPLSLSSIPSGGSFVMKIECNNSPTSSKVPDVRQFITLLDSFVPPKIYDLTTGAGDFKETEPPVGTATLLYQSAVGMNSAFAAAALRALLDSCVDTATDRVAGKVIIPDLGPNAELTLFSPA